MNEITTIKPEKPDYSKAANFAVKPITKKVIPNNPLLNELISFVYSINNNSKILTTPEDSFKSLYLAEKIMEKLNKKQTA